MTGTEMDAGEQLAWLDAVLRGCAEGVLICDHEAGILFYNPAVERLLYNNDKLHVGCLLSDVFSVASVEQALRLMEQPPAGTCCDDPEETDIPLVFATANEGAFLRCRLCPLPEGPGGKRSFAIIFDRLRRAGTMPRTACQRLCGKVEELRGPLANLRAAAENLVTHAEMAPVMRRAFEKIIAQESIVLTERFRELVETSRVLALSYDRFGEIYSADLIHNLKQRLKKKHGPAVTGAATRYWLKVDPYSLLPVLEFLVGRIKELVGVSGIAVDLQPGEGCVYLDFIWDGEPVPAGEIEAWRRQPLADSSTGGLTVAEVLEQHSSDLWSQPCQAGGRSMVRMPVPAGRTKTED